MDFKCDYLYEIAPGCNLDLMSHELCISGSCFSLQLQRAQLKCLDYLAEHHNQEMIYEEILNQSGAWEDDPDDLATSKNVQDAISGIKKRIDAILRQARIQGIDVPEQYLCIKNVARVGYKFVAKKTPRGVDDKEKHVLSAKLNFAQDKILGRENELKRISMLVNEGHKPIVIWGEGGIGKTELALAFCKGLDASKCHFVRYHSSIKDTIAGLVFSNTPETHKELSVEKKFEKHIEWLKEYDDTHLLILDNFDDDSKTLAELLAEHDLARICQLRFKLIITTRNKPQFPMSNAIHLESLPETELLELIKRYYQRREADGTTDDELRALIRALDGHTLCCELAAKTLQASHNLKPKDVLVSLHGNDNEESLAIVDTEKDRRGYSGRITDHIKNLYTISSLTSEEIETMRLMLLTSPDGIDHSLLLNINFGIQQAPLQALIKKGWLSKAQNTDLITIHPVVRSFCMLTPELQPTLIEEQFLDFIDNLYAFAGHPSDRSAYFHLELHTPYDEWRKEEKNFYRQWEQVENTMRFLVESVGQFVPAPVTVDQAKSYFDYVDTFLNLRQERNGPPIPWEYVSRKRYLAADGIGIRLGRKLAFRMRSLAFDFLKANLPTDDPFWGMAYDHMGRSYMEFLPPEHEEWRQNQASAKDCFEKAIDWYMLTPSDYSVELVGLYDRLSENHAVSNKQKLEYARTAVDILDEFDLDMPLECAKFCKRIAFYYRIFYLGSYKTQWIWLMREEAEYLSAYKEIVDTPSISLCACNKNNLLADVYRRIAVVHHDLNEREIELEYRLRSVKYAMGLIERKLLPGDLIDDYLQICTCQWELQRHEECLNTCCAIIKTFSQSLCRGDRSLSHANQSVALHISAKEKCRYSKLFSAFDKAVACCCCLERQEKAISLWTQLESLKPWQYPDFRKYSPNIYANLAACFAAKKNFEKQYEYEIRALEAKRECGLINLQEFLDESTKVAVSLIKQEQFAAARHHLLRIINIYDEHSSQENIQINPQVYMAMAQCLLKLGKTERALSYALIYAETAGKKRYAKFLRWLQKLGEE